MAEKVRWVEKVMETFLNEIETPPSEKGEHELMRKIVTLIQFRANGMDHRRMGLLAADVYRLVRGTRKRIIEDMAKVAAGAAARENT